jgi:hypothetical protein
MVTLGYGDTSLSGHRESKKDLDRFIKTTARYCKKQYGEMHYVWVAEIQEKRLARTGESVVHYHLLTPHYIPKKLINKAWNNAVNKPRINNGLPTQTLYPQIISAYNAGAYAAKYCQKEGHLIAGMPRPKNPLSRTKVITTRYNEDEFRAIEQYAKSVGLPTRTLIHQAVLSYLEQNKAPTKVFTDNPNQLSIDDKVD